MAEFDKQRKAKFDRANAFVRDGIAKVEREEREAAEAAAAVLREHLRAQAVAAAKRDYRGRAAIERDLIPLCKSVAATLDALGDNMNATAAWRGESNNQGGYNATRAWIAGRILNELKWGAGGLKGAIEVSIQNAHIQPLIDLPESDEGETVWVAGVVG